MGRAPTDIHKRYRRLATKVAREAARLYVQTGAQVRVYIAPPPDCFVCEEGDGSFVVSSSEESAEKIKPTTSIRITEENANLLAYRGTFAWRSEHPANSDAESLLPKLRAVNKTNTNTKSKTKSKPKNTKFAASMELADACVKECVAAVAHTEVDPSPSITNAIADVQSQLAELASQLVRT